MNRFFNHCEVIDIFFGCETATELLRAREELEYIGNPILLFASVYYDMKMASLLFNSNI